MKSTNNNSVVAIIPARGGSKRISKKNVRNFDGKPIISYAIEAAKQSKLFDHIIVSTDSSKIADTAKTFGAETPFMRPPALADDYTPTAPVILHALTELEKIGISCDIAFCIYPANPFLKVKYLREGLNQLIFSGAPSAFSVTTYPSSIYRSYQVDTKGCLHMIWPEYELTRSQDISEAYMDAGQFYCVWKDRFLDSKRFNMEGTRPIKLPRHLVHDIDTMEDWIQAELIYRALKNTDLF